MERKILFLVDHKHRDLASLALIGFHLQKLYGWQPSFVAVGQEHDVFSSLKPDYVVIPKPTYDLSMLLKWKLNNTKIVVIETEGNPQDHKYKYRIRVKPDLFLFWNDSIHGRYYEELNPDTKTGVLGFYRSDLLHKNWKNAFLDRSSFLEQHGLSPEKQTVTIATSSQESHLSNERLKAKHKRRLSSLEQTGDYLKIVENHKILRNVVEEFLKTSPNQYPDLNFVLKPHPHENAVYWKQLIEKLGNANVALSLGHPINDLLSCSDLHIAYNVCTTTVEAGLAGVTTVEIQTKNSKLLYASEHLDLPKYRATCAEELDPLISKELLAASSQKKRSNSISSPKLKEYITHYLHKFDGNRCQAYAQFINEWHESNLKKPNCSISFPEHIKFRLGLITLTALNYFRQLLSNKNSKKFLDSVNKPTASKNSVLIKGKFIQKEFGLFDNRMQLGDEKEWFNKFEKIMRLR